MLLLRVHIVNDAPAVIVEVAEATVNFLRESLAQLARQHIDICFVVNEQVYDIFASLLEILEIVHLLKIGGFRSRCCCS